MVLVLLTGQRAFAAQSCEISQATFDADEHLMAQPVPTHVRLQGSRYVDLKRTARGLSCSGVPLVAFDGLHYRQGGWSDDPGLYYVAPELARFSGLGLTSAIDVVLAGAVLLASVVGLAAFFRLVQTQIGRRVGIIALLLLTTLELFIGDVYIMNAAPVVACVPWILYFASRKSLTAGMTLGFVLCGFAAETANLFRSHAGTGTALFVLLMVLGSYQVRPAARVALLILFVLGGAAPALWFRQLYHERDAFLKHQPGALIETENAHLLWHNIYIGLGYIPNSEVPGYSDTVAANKVHQLRPDVTYVSPEYDRVLKQEILRTAKEHPVLILENVCAKSAVVLLFLIVSANVGLWAAKLAPKPAVWQLAFVLPILFNGLFGILVIPNPKYVLGLIAFAALWSVYSIDYAATQPAAHPYLARWRRAARS